MRFLTYGLLILFLVGCNTPGGTHTESGKKSISDQNQLPLSKTESGLRKRIVVLPFLDANPQRSPEFHEKSRQAFMTSLNRTGEVLAVDSSELKVDLKKFIVNDDYNLKDLAPASRDLGVTALLEGKLMDLHVKRKADAVGMVRQLNTQFEAVVRVRMASATSGKEIFNTVKTVTLDQGDIRVAERVQSDKFIADNPQLLIQIVKDAFLDFTPQIVATLGKITWEGRIAMISGDRIYINVGKMSGLQIGDLLKVTEEGDDIFDPESGGHIGRATGRTKGTLEVVSYFGKDGAVSVIHSGSGFKENDRVEIYQ